MPPSSIGFWVARTMKGSGSRWVWPSTVTWSSSIASSSADWVLGEARLISSASRTWANTGPRRNSNPVVRGSKTDTPVTSPGSRSGVNCTRSKEQPLARASALASMVLPTPGTSSMSTWPRQRRASTHSSISASFPTITVPTLSTRRVTRSCTRADIRGPPGPTRANRSVQSVYGAPFRPSAAISAAWSGRHQARRWGANGGPGGANGGPDGGRTAGRAGGERRAERKWAVRPPRTASNVLADPGTGPRGCSQRERDKRAKVPVHW